MPDKEILKMIKQKYMNHEHDYNLKSSDIDWLIKQAERVHELEEENMQLKKDIKEWEVVNDCWEEINTRLIEQNKYYHKQNERYHEDIDKIKEDNLTLKYNRTHNKEYIYVLERQIEYYREALEFYADKDNYVPYSELGHGSCFVTETKVSEDE